MATKVKIKIRAFPYYTEERDLTDPRGERTVMRENIAVRGQEVELSDVDLERAERFDAIQTDEDEAVEEATGSLDVATATPETLAEWIEEDEPTVDETVAAANDDPNVAQRLLDAEHLATGDEPRKGVVEGLNRIINRG